MITPFDLHVLSTPPAFILSQDQTLDYRFPLWQISASPSLVRLPSAPTFCLISGPEQAWLLLYPACSPLSDSALEEYFYSSFPFYLVVSFDTLSENFLLNFQGCITVYLSRFYVAYLFFVKHATLVYYHTHRKPSIPFVKFIKVFWILHRYYFFTVELYFTIIFVRLSIMKSENYLKFVTVQPCHS